MSADHVHRKHAEQLLSLGFVCLPLLKGGKHLDLGAMGYDPVHLRTMRKTHKEAMFKGITIALSQKLPTEEEIVRWFDRCEGNVGILTGYNGLLVLDFDNMSVFHDWSDRHATISSCTPIARTPRGIHVFLKSDSPLLSSSMYCGWQRIGHIKSLAGYVVSSPSQLRDGSAYNWLPGQSLFECSPQPIKSIESLTLSPCSPVKRCYDRILGRGYFEQG